MYLVKSPYIIREISKKSLTWNVKGGDKQLFITFDDGPIPEVTPDVLDVLATYNAKATFFMVGENAQRYPEIVNKIKDGGHNIGNHTFNHMNGTKVSDREYFKNIIQAREIIDSKLFRPPYGRIRPRQILELKKNFKIVLWSVLSGDFDYKTNPERCLNNVIKHAKSGSIIVFHDSLKAKENMLYALKGTLEHFGNMGFEFLAINQNME
ncbi:MAG: polysaccharide deacetylase family protein [Bacteroidetes bacterium]|nr:MAG: polysaccharide deacetylase family protein [Bacteroidota bacterium]